MNAHHRRFEDVNTEYTDVPAGQHQLGNYTKKHYDKDAETMVDSFMGVYEDWLHELSSEDLSKELEVTSRKWSEAANAEDTNAYSAWDILRSAVLQEMSDRK